MVKKIITPILVVWETNIIESCLSVSANETRKLPLHSKIKRETKDRVGHSVRDTFVLSGIGSLWFCSSSCALMLNDILTTIR